LCAERKEEKVAKLEVKNEEGLAENTKHSIGDQGDSPRDTTKGLRDNMSKGKDKGKKRIKCCDGEGVGRGTPSFSQKGFATTRHECTSDSSRKGVRRTQISTRTRRTKKTPASFPEQAKDCVVVKRDEESVRAEKKTGG